MSQRDPSEPLPTGRWPFTGREERTERITALLRTRQGRGVVLAGGAGVGRSRLAAEAARTLGPVRRVVGTRCGAALRFSAFAGLLPAGTGTVSPVRELAAVLRAPGHEPPVLVVDDAHLLDPGSAALVHHLAVRRDVRLLVTVRDGEPAPDAIVALWKDDLLRRLEVPPLSHDDLTRVLESALGGHVEARAVRKLTAICGGDLRMIRELVMAGTLTSHGGIWGWRGRPAVNGCVRELMANRLGDLDPREWDALTYLAFGAPEPVTGAGRAARPASLGGRAEPVQAAGSGAVERLEAKGLLTCYGDAPYAEVIRAMCGPLRAARVVRTLAASAGPEDVLQAAVWRLDSGLPADPLLLTEACRVAVAGFEVPLAVRLGRAAVAAGAGEDATAALATALALRDPSAPGDVRPLHAEHERVTAAVLAGDLTAEPAFGADSEWDLAGAAYCGQLSRLHRLRGEVGRALACGHDGAWRLPRGTTAFAGLCLGELAHAAALLGDVATARQALTEARDRGRPAFRALDTSAELAAPWVEAAAGDQAGAVRRALAAGEHADDAEVALFSLHSAVRLGAAEHAADRLARLASEQGGPVAALFARHASASADDDAGALRTVAREFEVLGMTLYAAEAHAQAARAGRRTGEHRHAKASAATGWTLSRLCQGARTPALAELTAPELTLRQLEIARLAASGLSNRAIAERLTVSIRTVANHLCGAYERLGVNDRAGLARLLAGLDRRVA